MHGAPVRRNGLERLLELQPVRVIPLGWVGQLAELCIDRDPLDWAQMTEPFGELVGQRERPDELQAVVARLEPVNVVRTSTIVWCAPQKTPVTGLNEVGMATEA